MARVNTPRCTHLLAADEALAEDYRPGGYLTLCGEVIDTLSLPSARCPDECDCELTYCPGCLDVATNAHPSPTTRNPPIRTARRTNLARIRTRRTRGHRPAQTTNRFTQTTRHRSTAATRRTRPRPRRRARHQPRTHDPTQRITTGTMTHHHGTCTTLLHPANVPLSASELRKCGEFNPHRRADSRGCPESRGTSAAAR
jgi:hypothetical protein